MKILSTHYISLISRISPIRLIAAGVLASGLLMLGGAKTAEASILLKAPPNNLGLVGLWNFNAGAGTTVADSSGSGNTGTLTNGPTWADGKFGKGLNCDGVNDYVGFASGNQWAYSRFTFSTWIKFAGNSGASVFNMPIGLQNQYYLNVRSDDGVMFRVAGTGWQTAIYTTNLTGAWHHIVGVFDGSYVYIYLDGVVHHTTAFIGTYTPSTSAPLICNYDGSGGLYTFNGLIDEIRIYNRALSAVEVRALYNSTGVGKVNSSRNNPASNLQNGLVAWHTFDGDKLNTTTSTDSSTSGNNGILAGSPNPTPTIGKVGSALKFSGTSQVSIPSTSSLSPSQISVAFWVKLPDAGTYRIIDKDTPEYVIRSIGTSMELVTTAGCTTFLDSATAPTPNVWQHWVVTMGSSGCKIYRNGIEDASNGTAYTASSGGTLYFSGPVSPLTGSLDDIRIYNRVLSAAEILQLYNATGGGNRVNTTLNNPVSNLQSGLVGWWPFDGKYMTTTTSTDISGNNNNGTLTGANGKPTPVIGKMGSALRFDGVDDRIALTSLNRGSGPYTISAWVKPNDIAGFVATDGAGIIGSISVSTGDLGDFFLSVLPNGQIQFANFRDTSTVGNKYRGGSITNNNWYLITAVYDGSTNKIYIDGVSQAFETINSGSGWGVTTNIGAHYLSSAWQWDGSIDDVRVYNRALSAGEVLQLYNMGK